MKILFLGYTKNNSGPSNVNKGITSNLTNEYWTIPYENKWISWGVSILKLFFCDVLVVSGLSRHGALLTKLAKKINKKAIYIMHGCYTAEMELNEETPSAKETEYERCLLELSDLILPVSKRYMLWLIERYPQYSDKMDYLYNGVEENKTSYEGVERKKGTVIAAGGDRKLKNNIVVAQAMKELDSKAKLQVYGYIHNPDNLPKCDNVKFMGLVSQKEFYEQMASTDVFVLNSLLESFGLSAIDALNCGCSVLISKYAGVVDILELKDSDIIFDPMDKNEIASKVKYLIEHPNNERLVARIDYDNLSYKAEIERLTHFCTVLLKK